MLNRELVKYLIDRQLAVLSESNWRRFLQLDVLPFPVQVRDEIACKNYAVTFPCVDVFICSSPLMSFIL